MLYKRVIQVAETLAGDRATLGKGIGIQPRTFQGYLNEEREHNLWPLLPKILEAFPRVSRQWLYFNEGPMLIGHGIPLDKPVPVEIVKDAVRQMAEEAGGTNQALFRYVCGLPAEDGSGGDLKLLAAENEQLRKQVIELQARVISLLEEKNSGLQPYGMESSLRGKNLV